MSNELDYHELDCISQARAAFEETTTVPAYTASSEVWAEWDARMQRGTAQALNAGTIKCMCGAA